MPAPPANPVPDAPAARAPRRRWPWWKRLLAGFGLVVLLLAIFYQPIIFAAVKFVAPRLAAKQGLRLNDFQLGGTIFTGLRVQNLQVTPTAPGPIEKANVGLLEIHYSLLTLIRHGLNSGFIESLTLHDVDVIYDASKSPPPPPKKKEAFSLPPLPFPGQISLRNVNFELRPASHETAKAAGQSAASSPIVPSPVAPAVAGVTTAAVDDGFLIRGLNLELDPARTGELRVGELRVPGGPDLRDVSATTSYRDRNLQLANLVIAPEIRVRTLSIDGSKAEAEQLLTLSLDADLFDGRAGASVAFQGIGTPPKASVKSDVAGVSLASVRRFLKLDTPLDGTLENLTVRFDGISDQPKSWTGRVELKVTRPVYDTTALDAVTLRLTLRDGVVQLEDANITQGANKVSLRGKVQLTDKVDDLPKSTGAGTLEIDAPDLGKLPAKLPAALAGSFHLGGDFAMAGGEVTANFKGHVQSLNAPAQAASAAGIDFALELAKTLPPPVTPGVPPPPFYDGMQTRVSAVINQIQYTEYKIDGVKLALSSDGPAIKLEQIEVTRGANRIDADGDYVLPADFAAWEKNPLDVRLSIALPDVTQFAADPGAAAFPLQGRFNAKGNVTLRNGVYGGGFDLEADDLKAKSATVRSANVQIAIENNEATIRSGHIVYDDKNTIDLTGKGSVKAPYAFDAGLTVDLGDLSRFNPVLAANGVDQPLAGSVRITGKANGHMATAPGANDQKIDGTLEVAARDLQAKGTKIAAVDTQIVVENNRAVIKQGKVQIDAKTAVTFGGQAGLAAPYNYQGNLDVDVPDLGVFASLLQAGDAKEKVTGTVHVAAEARGHLATAPDAKDLALDGTVKITGKDIQAKGATIQRIDGQIDAANQQALIKTLQIRFNDKNTIDLRGQAALQAPFAYQANLNVNLTDLSVFEPLLRASQAEKPPAAGGQTAAQAAGTPKPREVNGPRARPGAPNATANTRAGKVALSVKGTPKGKTPATPAGSAAPAAPKLAGALLVQWQAQGDFTQTGDGPRFSGGGKIAAHKVEFNTVGPLEADIEGKYEQLAIDFPTIFVSTNGLEFRSAFTLKDALARLDKIQLKQGATELLAGYAQFPLDLTKLSAPGGPVPDVDKIDVNIASKALPLQTLFASLDKTRPAPAQGTLQLQVDAHGSLSKITADVKLQARALHAPQTPTIRPADADVNLVLHDNRLDLDTVLRQPQIQPLTIKGNVPLDLHAIIGGTPIDPSTPVTLNIQLPRSSLGFLAGVTKAVRFIQGDVAADIKVGGTIKAPTFAGSTELNIVAARAENITVPAIRDFAVRLAFTNKELRFERFSGEIGGGKLGVSGNMGFASLTDPTLDLAVTANNVLAARNDNLTARVNADVKIKGPLAEATVSGRVGITKSRYLKDIDIVPLNLPGKPAPAPPAPADSTVASIGTDAAPFNAWKLDLAIKTDDPFYIRGNLAKGQALVDLHLGGTGAKPLLDGNVEIQNLTASLPFSKLEITTGNLNFTPDQPLNPVLDINGSSTIRNYLITLYVTGRANDPKVTFTSDPPLAQEQIVSLLATGATTDELAGSTQALAGKATLLVLQDLYRRTFKKKSSSVNAEPKETLADRVSLNVGDTDPATGKQQVSAGFKVTDQVQFVADLGIEGDLRGRVKYLIRFR